MGMEWSWVDGKPFLGAQLLGSWVQVCSSYDLDGTLLSNYYVF